MSNFGLEATAPRMSSDKAATLSLDTCTTVSSRSAILVASAS